MTRFFLKKKKINKQEGLKLFQNVIRDRNKICIQNKQKSSAAACRQRKRKHTYSVYILNFSHLFHTSGGIIKITIYHDWSAEITHENNNFSVKQIMFSYRRGGAQKFFYEMLHRTLSDVTEHSRSEWVNQLWHIYTMEYYSSTKRNGLLLHLTIWTHLKCFMLSERA